MTKYATTADRFAIDTKTHRLEIAQDDGLYRHLKLRAHDEDGRMRSTAWFDIVTTPGMLVFTGDYDSVVFRRLPDMFEFFRDSAYKGEPNFDYWAEKIASGGIRSVREYSEDVFRQVVREHVADDIRTDQAPRGIGRALREFFDPNPWEHDLTFEEGARAALEGFDYQGYRFRDRDLWEWSFDDYTHDFRWACYAIVHGIREYDRAKDAQVRVKDADGDVWVEGPAGFQLVGGRTAALSRVDLVRNYGPLTATGADDNGREPAA